MIDQNNIPARVANIKRQLEQYKYNQTFNFSSVTYPLTDSGNSYDVAITVPANSMVNKILTLTPASGNLPYTTASAFFRVDNSSVMASPTPANSPYLILPENKLMWLYILPLVPLNNAPRYLLRAESVSASTRTVYVKAYVSTTDDLTWGWS